MTSEPNKVSQEEIKDLPETGKPLSSENLEDVVGGTSAGGGVTQPGGGFTHQCFVGNVQVQD